MGKGKRKKPFAEKAPGAIEKTPRGNVPPNYDEQVPSWRFSSLQTVEPFGWHEITREDLDLVLTQLKGFETMTWTQIKSEVKRKSHFVEASKICKKARERLNALGSQVDVDLLFSLRLTGKGRVWGFLRRGILDILWWDPKHEVWPISH
ncbi:MAG: hypothetical protein IT371_14350 [Deltaproteobacteria bacterium]|nr:hypothetical protein [Deltaproteobacteria bacterium]